MPTCPRLRTRPAALAAVVLALAGPLAAQGSGTLELPRLPGLISFDGMPDDAVWREVAALPLVMYRPTFRGRPTDSTVIRVAYDDEFVYAAGEFFDPDPSQLRVNSLYRDRWNGDDTFALYLDSFNDNETGLWFYTNPAGVRFDAALSADGRTFNGSWNGAWDVATRITDRGWFMEMRIPLATLGFQQRDGRVVMGMAVTRLMARRSERVTFPAIDPRYEFRQPSVYQDVTLEGVTARRPLYATPYVLGGVNRIAVLPPGAPAWRNETEAVHEVGGDLRYGIGDNLNLDLSVNTDFAQVEADDEQVNLTRFPLFFPEKRQFFQERSGVFDFDFGSGGRLFHSRQIGLAPDRTPIRILGGARAVARTGPWDIGVLDMQTASRGATPAENLGVARVRRRVLNDFSYAGGMVTSRVDADGGYNVATGLDASLRLFGDTYLTARGATTFDPAADGGSLPDRSQVHLEWANRTQRGLNYFAQLHRVGPDYRPDLGFLPRADFTRWSVYGQYRTFLADHPLLRSHGVGAIGYGFHGNDDGALETRYLAYWWIYELRGGGSGWLEVIHHFEAVPQAFDLGEGVMVEPGEYHFETFWFNYQAGSGAKLRLGADAKVGRFYDGRRATLTLTPTWNLSRHFDLSGSYEFNRLTFPRRDAALSTHLARVRIGAALNARASAVALVQANSVTDRLGVNLRLRYNVREGTDLWLVYNEGIHTDRDGGPAGGPAWPRSTGRSVQVKWSHTLAF